MVEYDKYYQTEKLFGAPYPELIAFYSGIKKKGKLLDLGCGQGRDAIALAKLGYEVTGIDNSAVGIEQLKKVAKEETLSITCMVGDIYGYRNFNEFEFILLDSMFHFRKQEREKEIQLLKKIFETSRLNTLITICIQNTGNKLKVLDKVISASSNLAIFNREHLIYQFEDEVSGHNSKTEYEMVTIRKL